MGQQTRPERAGPSGPERRQLTQDLSVYFGQLRDLPTDFVSDHRRAERVRAHMGHGCRVGDGLHERHTARPVRQASVQQLGNKGGLAMDSEIFLNCHLPPHEPPDAVVPLLCKNERGSQEVRKAVLEPVLNLERASRGERDM
ncbi:hypothetical protein G9U51_04815 [Calidifontibacter sp. DB0510]|uniref:Uncharacterized protein n=1 Tax=Metallococcus carri TaxID=1656884 RepID=A0A967AY34_9MICO|nr:hypothetical protein [Metallococcus carri]NHN55109.1 hypothetical protein [Metallococcus carri]NOP36186.1 hypothetical protein [Calidifontibacter sp. DB2511S]